MPKVYNWQLGRQMDYPHREAHPRSQFAFVFNINRCIACQTCTMACKSTWTFSKGQEYMWWNNVETKPYGGYPQFWDTKLLQLLDEAHKKSKREATWDPAKRDVRQPYGVYEGMTIFEAARAADKRDKVALGYEPTDAEWSAPNIYEDTATGSQDQRASMNLKATALPEHQTWFFYLQRLCNHCTYPACLSACPRKAIYKRPEDGIVLIDQKRCRGYRKKCIACYPRIEGKDALTAGEPMETRCMTACVGKIRLQGLVRVNEDGSWAEDRENPLYHLVKVEKVALPLYPQFGTEPNGYYIPPRWVPRPYLRQMFGPGVDEAIERYTRPSRELLAVLQLFRASQTIVFKYKIVPGEKVFEATIDGKKWAMYNDTVIGYSKSGKEVARVTVEEPKIVRPDKHFNSI
jgi:nitrate reductase / nitrite oxidoreductase, beta subunit